MLRGVRVPQRAVEGRRDRDRERRHVTLPHSHHGWLQGIKLRNNYGKKDGP